MIKGVLVVRIRYWGKIDNSVYLLINLLDISNKSNNDLPDK